VTGEAHVENRSDDRCTKITGRTKTAAGISIYLVEELGDARMRCAQLKLLINEAQKLVEKSTHRDHIFEVAAHLLHSIPDNLFRLEKALDAAAMSAARLDYEEIKQNLKPEKAEELEQMLSDSRLRYLNRRSQQLSSPKTTLAEIERLASVTEQTGRVPVTELLVLAAALETGVKTASEAPSAAQQLRDIAVAASAEKSRTMLARAIRTFLADAMEPTAAHTMQALVQSASSREDVMEGFKDANPDLTDDQLKEIADQWEKNKDVVKDKAATSKGDWQEALKKDEANLVQMRADLKTLEDGGKVENLTVAGAKSVIDGLEQVIANKKKLLSKFATTSGEVLSKFEEGKPADPTENMSPEDAKNWHEMNDKYKDVVKDQHKTAKASPQDLTKAREMGEAAFKAGKKCVPAWDKELAGLLKGRGVTKDVIQLLTEWQSGWTKANLADDSWMQDLAEKAVKSASLGLTSETEMIAKFEEGKPADPTEQMSPEDAEKWEAMNDKYKDVIKDKHARVAKILNEVGLSKTAFVPDALTGERVALFVDSLRDRTMIAQRALRSSDWRHFKMSLRHFVTDLSAIFGAFGMADAVTKMDLIQRELVGTPLGTPLGAVPQSARLAMSKEASSAWQSYSPLFVEASSREKVMEGFKSANPKLTDEQLEEIADHWEKHKDVVKDKHKSASAGDPLTGAWSAISDEVR
jgi:uncharacterized protein YeaO (DUF488 family)